MTLSQVLKITGAGLLIKWGPRGRMEGPLLFIPSPPVLAACRPPCSGLRAEKQGMSLSLGDLLSSRHRVRARAALLAAQLPGCVTLGTALHLCALASSPIQCSYQVTASQGSREAPSTVRSLWMLAARIIIGVAT